MSSHTGDEPMEGGLRASALCTTHRVLAALPGRNRPGVQQSRCHGNLPSSILALRQRTPGSSGGHPARSSPPFAGVRSPRLEPWGVSQLLILLAQPWRPRILVYIRGGLVPRIRSRRGRIRVRQQYRTHVSIRRLYDNYAVAGSLRTESLVLMCVGRCGRHRNQHTCVRRSCWPLAAWRSGARMF
jgi:hypothetical protein